MFGISLDCRVSFVFCEYIFNLKGYSYSTSFRRDDLLVSAYLGIWKRTWGINWRGSGKRRKRKIYKAEVKCLKLGETLNLYSLFSFLLLYL